MKPFFSILSAVFLLPVFAGKISFSPFHPVSESMTVQTPFLNCRFVKHHAFPARIMLPEGKAIPWFGFADGIIRKSDGFSFRTEHDYWCKFKVDPQQRTIETRALFCRRVWKPHPQPLPDAEAVYLYRFSNDGKQIDFSCTVKMKKDPDLKPLLLALRWPKDTAPSCRLSKDQSQAELIFPQAKIRLTGKKLSVVSDDQYFQIAPQIQWQKQAATASLNLTVLSDSK